MMNRMFSMAMCKAGAVPTALLRSNPVLSG
jgi:hypothetical protein